MRGGELNARHSRESTAPAALSVSLDGKTTDPRGRPQSAADICWVLVPCSPFSNAATAAVLFLLLGLSIDGGFCISLGAHVDSVAGGLGTKVYILMSPDMSAWTVGNIKWRTGMYVLNARMVIGFIADKFEMSLYNSSSGATTTTTSACAKCRVSLSNGWITRCLHEWNHAIYTVTTASK